MAVWRFVDFFVPQAQRLADLTGVQYDLQMVEHQCEMILPMMESESLENMRLREALCISAITSYGRTFVSGVRSGVTREQLDRLEAGLQDKHVYFKDLRDKWIAHSVNAFEDNRVCAYLVPEERGERAVASISVQQHRVLTLSGLDIVALQDLASSLRKIVEADIAVENQKVLAYARSLPVDQFYAATATPPAVPGTADARRSRRRYSES